MFVLVKCWAIQAGLFTSPNGLDEFTENSQVQATFSLTYTKQILASALNIHRIKVFFGPALGSEARKDI